MSFAVPSLLLITTVAGLPLLDSISSTSLYRPGVLEGAADGAVLLRWLLVMRAPRPGCRRAEPWSQDRVLGTRFWRAGLGRHARVRATPDGRDG